MSVNVTCGEECPSSSESINLILGQLTARQTRSHRQHRFQQRPQRIPVRFFELDFQEQHCCFQPGGNFVQWNPEPEWEQLERWGDVE